MADCFFRKCAAIDERIQIHELSPQQLSPQQMLLGAPKDRVIDRLVAHSWQDDLDAVYERCAAKARLRGFIASLRLHGWTLCWWFKLLRIWHCVGFSDSTIF